MNTQRKFLPVDEDSRGEEQEFNLATMSAMDYLKQVQFERKKIPQVVTVHPMTVEKDSDTEKEGKNVSEKIFHPHDPTSEWCEIQKDRFTAIQQRIIDLRNDPDLSRRLQVIEDLDTANSRSSIEFCQEHEPKLSIILTLNQGQLEELLEILCSHLCSVVSHTDFQPETASLAWLMKWIYALMGCLRLPLDPEVHNKLRMIAKSCIHVTKELKTIQDTTVELFLPWNLIIVVIAVNFHQFDLLSL